MTKPKLNVVLADPPATDANGHTKLQPSKNRAERRKAKEPTRIKLDIACGQNKQQGYVGIDLSPNVGAELVHDLEQYPWPVEDDLVEEAFCSHYVEHVSDLCAFMNELYRILMPGGKVTIITPYYTSMRAWQDPTHKRAISEATYLYFNKEWRTNNKLDHYPIVADFDFYYAFVMTPDWAARADDARAYAIRHYFNVVNDLQVTLTKRPKDA